MKILLGTIVALVTTAEGNRLEDPVPQRQIFEEPARVLRGEAGVMAAADLAISGFTISQAITPAIGGSGKKCHQLACWIETPTEACGMAGANQVQRELTRGRNSFAVESVQPSGMQVRYWRTMFSPPDQGDIATGTCSDGNKFVVNKCQATGKVHC